MAKYDIDGIQYEIDDSVDLRSAVEAIRRLPDHKPKEDPSYASRVMSEGLPAVANMGMDILQSIPAGLAGLDTLVRTGSGAEAAATFESGLTATRADLPRFRSPEAQMGEQALMHGLEAGIGAVGSIPEATTDVFKQGAQALGQSLGMENVGTADPTVLPGTRTAVEAATNFLPIPGTKAVGRIPHVGSEWKVARAETALRESVLKAAAEEQAKISKAQADAAAYEKAYAELDNTMTPYGKDRVGPQYGGSKRMDRHADEQGRREGPAMDRNAGQEAFDADMRRLAEEYNVQRVKDENTAKFVDQWHPEEAPLPSKRGDLPKYDPETGYLIKERVKGPEATTRELTDPEAIAFEIRRRMDRVEPTDSIKGWEQVDSTPQPERLGYNERLRVMQEDPASFSVREMLTEIASNSRIPYYREVAKLALADKSFNSRFNLRDAVPDGKGETWRGWFNPAEYRIELMKQFAGEEQLFLHEVSHARTHAGIEFVLRAPGEAKHLVPAVTRLNELYTSFKQFKGAKAEAVEREFGHPGKYYGLRTIHEFVAEAFTNPDFQAMLARTEAPRHLRSKGFRLYWDTFVDAIGKLLGFDQTAHTYLSETIKAGADIMHGTDGSFRRAWDRSNIGVDASGVPVDSYSFKDFKQDASERGIILSDAQMKAIWDAQQPKTEKSSSGNPNEAALKVVNKVPGLNKLQRLMMETRTLEEMRPEIASAKDTSLFGTQVIGKIINGDYMAKDHPILSWASSNINRIKNKYLNEANQLLHGDSKTKPSPGTYNYEWSKLSVKDRIQVNELGQALNNAQSKLDTGAIQAKARQMFGKELSAKQLAAYNDRLRINSEILGKINTVLKAEGRELINELPHYWSPAEFNGKFLTILEGKDGSKIVRGSYLKPDEGKIKAEFPDHKVKIVERDRSSSIDMDQFIELFRILDKELRDPASRALAEAYKRKGFSRHGMKREGAAGARGTEGGRKGLHEYEEVSEKYVRQSHEYLANRELDKLYKELEEFPEAKRSPNAHAYALESIDQARGGINPVMDKLSQAVGDVLTGAVRIGTLDKVHLPNSALRSVLRGSNEIKSGLLLGYLNLQFMAANLIQSTYAIPKLIGMAAEFGNKGLLDAPLLASKVTAKTIADLVNPKNPDILKLQKLGTFEATLKYDWSTYSSDVAKFKHTLRDHLTGMSTNAFIESNAVRKPAALMFLNMLRELGYEKIAKSPDDIYWLAKNLTDDYMVSMQRHKKPHAFGRSGIVGTAVSPLQSFTTTWVAQFLEYAKQMKDVSKNPANVLPMATFLALNLTTAGLLGFVGVKEWDALAEFLNDNFHTNVPTGTEVILSKAKSDKLRFGMLSDAIGVHIGGTFSAPTVTGAVAPGVGFMGDAITAIWRAFKETGALGEMNKPKEAEKRDSLKALTPRSFAWGQIEKAYTPPGAPTQTKEGSAGPYTRTEKDWNARKLGMFTTEEVTGKASLYPVQRQMANRSKRLKDSTGLMVDSLLNGERPTERMELLIKELQKDNYTAAEIRESLKEQMKSKITEKDLKMMGKGQTNRQRLIIQMFEGLK